MGLLSTLREDLDNARSHDPAARGDLENAVVYSGLHAIWSYRLAHRLWARPALRGLARVLSQLPGSSPVSRSILARPSVAASSSTTAWAW